MKGLSEQLANAMADAGFAEKTVIYPGQLVVVRTIEGDYIGEGFVEDVDDERQMVRVRDTASGTDIQLDVDTTRYVLWIKPGLPFGITQAVSRKAIDLFMKARSPASEK